MSELMFVSLKAVIVVGLMLGYFALLAEIVTRSIVRIVREIKRPSGPGKLVPPPIDTRWRNSV